MSESVKAVASLVLILASVMTAVAWFLDQPGPAQWGLRIGAPIVGVLAIGVILKLHLRADAVPDYLRKKTARYFNRDGFCFTCNMYPCNEICYLSAWFQNQYDQPCHGRIALRPARGFLSFRPRIDVIRFDVHCEPAAYGCAMIPVPLSRKFQGRRQKFEVGASVDYPQGKGQRLRFADGIFLRPDENFSSEFTKALTVAGALTGQFVMNRPATVRLVLPIGVAEELPEDVGPEVKTLWRLGDPPLEEPA